MHSARVAAAAAGLVWLVGCGGGGGDASDPGVSPTPAPAPAAVPDAATAKERTTRLQSMAPALVDAPAGLLGNVVCRNWRIGAIALDNVQVAADAACLLDGTVVRGSVQAQGAAFIEAVDARIGGSVQSTRAGFVALHANTRITGSVQLDGGSVVLLDYIGVAGDIQLRNLTGPLLIADSGIAGNVQLTSNRGGGEVRGSRIYGSLQCTGNSPAIGVDNIAAASIQGDCVSSPPPGGGTPPAPPPPAAPAPGSNVSCNGMSLGALALDTVTVPAGGACNLAGTRLTGSLIIGSGAHVLAEAVQVAGNVSADGADSVSLVGASRIGGSVQIKQGGATTLAGATVIGDVQFDAMRGLVTVSGNSIGGSLQAMANRGGLSLAANRMLGNMQCKDNLPAPTGSGNVAAQKQDQCAGL